jgi:hypothetical protein
MTDTPHSEKIELPIFEAIKSGYRLAFECITGLWRASAILVVLLVAIDAAQVLAGANASGLDAVWQWVVAVLWSAGLAPYAVLIHRRVIMGDRQDRYLTAAWSRRVGHFAGLLVAFEVAPLVWDILLLPVGPVGRLVLMLIGAIVGMVVSLRLALAFPAIATDRAASPLADSWRYTRGFALLMLVLYLLANLPPVAVAVGLALTWNGDDVAAPFGMVWMAQHAAVAVIATVVTALNVAITSYLYRTRHAWSDYSPSD